MLKWVIILVILLNCWDIADTNLLHNDTLLVRDTEASNDAGPYRGGYCGAFTFVMIVASWFATTIIFIGINMILLSLIFSKRFLKKSARVIGVTLMLIGILMILMVKGSIT